MVSLSNHHAFPRHSSESWNPAAPAIPLALAPLPLGGRGARGEGSGMRRDPSTLNSYRANRRYTPRPANPQAQTAQPRQRRHERSREGGMLRLAHDNRTSSPGCVRFSCTSPHRLHIPRTHRDSYSNIRADTYS